MTLILNILYANSKSRTERKVVADPRKECSDHAPLSGSI